MQEKRVTQKDIALAAGLTGPTVSLALRHHPSIPKATRGRILAIADKLGYVRDPVRSVLATYRWPHSQMKRSTIAIALVEFVESRDRHAPGYPHDVRRGAMERAKALGFTVSIFRLSRYQGDVGQMLRAIHRRGIKGIVLLPSDNPVTLDVQAGWDNFSVVTATTAILAPRFHQVIPNQLYNMSTLLERLQQLGQWRIGAIFSEGYDERTTHSYSMALAWFGHRDRILILPGELTAPGNDRRVKAWLRRQKLDLVFTPDASGLTQLWRTKKTHGTSANVRLASPAAYFKQFPELIGAAAVRVLNGLLNDNETGIPTHPQVTTIDGAIREETIPKSLR